MDETMTFEQANQKFEETVEKLEDQDLSLAKSMELYAQACELLYFCVRQLEEYKGQITDIHKRIIEKKDEENV